MAAREAAAAASRAAREPAALQQLGVALSALREQVGELASRQSSDDGSRGGAGVQRLESRLMVSHPADMTSHSCCKVRLVKLSLCWRAQPHKGVLRACPLS